MMASGGPKGQSGQSGSRQTIQEEDAAPTNN